MDAAQLATVVHDVTSLLERDANVRAASKALDALLQGYGEFRDFDYSELALIEPLRAMRIVHYMAWLARRWEDPAFPRHFPWFNTDHYWRQQIATLHDQLAALKAPPLTLMPNW